MKIIKGTEGYWCNVCGILTDKPRCSKCKRRYEIIAQINHNKFLAIDLDEFPSFKKKEKGLG